MSSAHLHNIAIPKPKFSTDGFPEILRGKHKFRILWDLQFGSRRFGEIRKGLGLGKADGNVIPPRVEYRLTSLGRSLLRATSKILEWGKRHPACSHVGRGAFLIRSEAR